MPPLESEREKHWKGLARLYREPTFSRRRFLQYVSSSAALALAAGCEWKPHENAVQYIPLSTERFFYATLSPFMGFGEGVLAEIFEDRPIKLEGHPGHEDSLGAMSVTTQAAILDLYHPKRHSFPSPKKGLLALMEKERQDLKATRGKGALFCFNPTTSPWTQHLAGLLKETYPECEILSFSPYPLFRFLSSTEAVFGKSLFPVFDLSLCKNPLSVEADLFSDVPGRLGHIRAFADRRVSKDHFLPLSCYESFPTLMGLRADRHLKALSEKDLRHKDLLIPGPTLPLSFQQTLWWENKRKRAQGLRFMDNPFGVLSPSHSPEEVLKKAAWKRVFNFDVSFPEGFSAAEVYRSRSESKEILFSCFPPTKSSALALIPLSHFLESWECLRSSTGKLHLAQPTVNPLFHTKDQNEWLYYLIHGRFPLDKDFFEFLKQKFSMNRPEIKTALKTGKEVDRFSLHSLSGLEAREPEEKSLSIEMKPPTLITRPDPYVGFGERSHNEWLMELPRPYTQLCWENAFVLGPQTARHLKMKQGDVLKVTGEDESVMELPVLIRPLVGEGSVLLHLGFGNFKGKGLDVSFDVPLKKWEKTGRFLKPAVVQEERADATKRFAKDFFLEELSNPPEDFQKERNRFDHQLKTLRDSSFLKDMEKNPLQWAMTIDLSRCVGCSSCMVACQSENNVPCVGKEQILKGRPMHWIRLDHYDFDTEETVSVQPVPCMHCEKAPCEEVCPVGATVHSAEGLNQMVYNRCVGTRFCENNCPYKVRRFNYLSYSAHFFKDSLKWGLNPEVSVRSRGVMEKCTYCVQRIEEGKRKDRLREIKTACQSACPAKAIEFGNKADRQSLVAKNRKDPRHYALLSELGTLPRTTYLARLRQKEVL